MALDLQVDCIEIDASRTRDGVLVALHDRYFNSHFSLVKVCEKVFQEFSVHFIVRLDLFFKYQACREHIMLSICIVGGGKDRCWGHRLCS